MSIYRLEVSDRPVLASPVAVVWEETACTLCGRDQAELIAEAADPLPPEGGGLRFALVRCRHCGLTYTNPRPSPESISRFYPSDYSPHQRRPAARRRRVRPWLWHRLFGRPCPERRGYIRGMKPGRLLDVGCGGGSYLKRMADLGWAVTGLDPAAGVVQAVRDSVGCEVFVGTLPHPDLGPGTFDLVTLWQVLEHVHEPLATLREVRRLLVPGGRVVVAVPNFASLPAKWFGPHWFGLDLPRHLTHFTPATLRDTLRAAGFLVESLRGLVHGDWLRKSAARKLRSGQGGVASRLLRWKPAARAVAWACYALGRAEALVAVARRPA
jgi:2-polyprenyl-3-methyl-5-hydroxy-6-metoxy-1,4-benzoquinol methylase